MTTKHPSPLYAAHSEETGRCHHDLEWDCDNDYHAVCKKCGFEIPCDECAWASFCVLMWGDCKRESDIATGRFAESTAKTSIPIPKDNLKGGTQHPWDWRAHTSTDILSLPIAENWNGEGEAGYVMIKSDEKAPQDFTFAVFDKDSTEGWAVLHVDSGWYRRKASIERQPDSADGGQ